MRNASTLRLVCLILAAFAAGSPARAAGLGTAGLGEDQVRAKLIPENASIAPGGTLWVAVHLEMKAGWHTYWHNPGDAGLPTTIEWHLPSGFSTGDIRWPVPERFVLGKVGDYGYSGAVDLLVPIAAPRELASGQNVPLAAKITWLACADICIPGEAEASISLPVTGAALPDPAAAALFVAARRHLPQPADFETRFAAERDGFRLFVPARAFAGLPDPGAVFFPDDGSLLDHAATPEQQLDGEGRLVLTLARAENPAMRPESPATLDGVLALHGADGSARAFSISARPIGTPPTPETSLRAAVRTEISWRHALFLAFVGGMLLNLMPCVFPILSLKLLSLAAPVETAADRRRLGIAYAGGVLVSFTLLGAALLAVRAGGGAVGWGFQLQSPAIVAVLAYLLLATGLSLSGVAEFGGGLVGLGSRFAERPGIAGTFATGVLATIVATPCTAPFMGAALGFALLAPSLVAIGIFLALGAGLAFPLLLGSFIPGLHRALPRPGAWLATAKQLLAFPLYGTAAWLIWVLIQEVGPEASLAALSGLVLVGFAVWAYGRAQLAEPRPRRIGIGLAAAAAAAAIVLGARPPTGNEAATRAPVAAAGGLAYERFTPARLASLAAQRKPVFVNLTAAWCITCLVNERVVLDSAAVRSAFSEHGVVLLKGDWTSRNPDITALLLRYGRSGVPLYLLLDGSGAATVLPQLLTEAGVLGAIRGL
ncbi:MAG: thioredoxin family protein [Alphaproteobacteria bacterium]|nr:thioredoxin family protein [Alphaproteobacteria bacterium]